MEASEGLMVIMPDAGSDFDAFLEDDGKVAYLYLRAKRRPESSRIVADVWLWNCREPLARPEWRDRTKMPFANPEGLAMAEGFVPPRVAADVTYAWRDAVQGGRGVRISIRGIVHAYVEPGMKPGYCRLALKDGPLARVFPADWE